MAAVGAALGAGQIAIEMRVDGARDVPRRELPLAPRHVVQREAAIDHHQSGSSRCDASVAGSMRVVSVFMGLRYLTHWLRCGRHPQRELTLTPRSDSPSPRRRRGREAPQRMPSTSHRAPKPGPKHPEHPSTPGSVTMIATHGQIRRVAEADRHREPVRRLCRRAPSVRARHSRSTSFEAVTNGRQPVGEAAIEAIRPLFRRELSSRLHATSLAEGLAETTPRVTADTRLAQAREQLLDDCDGFLRRAAIEASLTAGERREILRGMILTRATDNRLKTFFNSGEVRYAEGIFQGKGFRSLGQEAIYAAAIRLKRGAGHRTRGRPLERRRRRAGHSRSRRHAGHEERSGDGPDGAERADGQGRSAVGRQGSERRRSRLGHLPAGGAARPSRR